MTRLTKTIVAVAVAGLLFGGAVPAQASMIGVSIEATALYPDLTAPIVIGGPVTAVVGAGTEFLNGDFGAFFGPSFDFGGDTITITHAATSHLAADFNGYRFTDILNGLPDILGFTVLSDTTGFFSGDLSRLTFDANNLWINFQGLDFGNQVNPTIVLGVRTAAVPEPATLLLFGVAGLAAARRRLDRA